MAAVFLALVDPDDEVIVFEPFYENYGPDAILAGAKPVFVPLEPPDWHFDPDRLAAAFTSRTKAIIVNTPHNPTGRVFSRDELSTIARPVHRERCLGLHGRDLRAHSLCGETITCWRAFPACVTTPSPFRVYRRRSVARAGAWATSSPHPRSRSPSARSTTS
jgi:hypothetical protein